MKKKINLKTAKNRIAIARDVLNQLKEENIKVSCGRFLESKLFSDFGIPASDQLNKHLKNYKCYVCAAGACFLSAVNNFNNFTVGELQKHLTDYDYYIKYLLKFFSHDQVMLIEMAFELGNGLFYLDDDIVICAFDTDFMNYVHYFSERQATNAIDFGAKYTHPKSRIKAIMNNIIENKGEFIP